MHTSMKIVIIVVILITTLLFMSNHYTSLTLHMHTEQLPQLSMGAVHTKHSVFIHSAPFSKDLIVHSVQFDNRARNGHDNVTVFFVGANKTIIDSKWIVGCAAGSKVASNFTAHFTITGNNLNNWLGPQSPRSLPYKEIIVECYDLPVMAGSPAYVMYKTAADSPVYNVESERPVYFPAPRVKPTGEHNFTVVTCVKVHNKWVTWLPEFVRYQRTIGVDHVHILMLDTFIKDGGLKAHLADPYLAQATLEGFVSYNMWIDWYVGPKKEMYSHSDNLRKLDCLYRFRGTYDYAFSLDTDDFFTPRIPGQTNVKDYILKWCYGNSIGSCTFNWIYYFPDKCGLIDNKRPDDGNVTKKLRSFANLSLGNYKSVHLISALVDASFHDAICKWCLMPGYRVVNVPPHIAYMAHLRKNDEHHIKC